MSDKEAFGMTNMKNTYAQNRDIQENNEKSVAKVINIISLYGPISIVDIKKQYGSRYIERLLKFLDPEDDKQLFKRIFCWQEISSHSENDNIFKGKLKNKVSDLHIYEYYFPHLKKEINIFLNSSEKNNLEVLELQLKSTQDKNNWVRFEIEKDPDNIFKYRKESFKATYCINGIEEENKSFFDLMSKDGKLYVYAVKYIPFQYRTFIARERNNEKIFREIEQMKEKMKKRGETMTYQNERSIWASKIYTSQKTRKKYMYYSYEINLRGFMKYFAYNRSSKINKAIERISAQPKYQLISDNIDPSAYEFIDFPFLINYISFKEVFPKNFIPEVLKEISHYVSTIIEDIDDLDLKYFVTSRFCDRLLSKYLCAGPNSEDKPINEIKKKNEKLFDTILNYFKNILHYIHTFEIKKADKRKHQINSLINPPHDWFKTIEIM